MYLEGGGGGGCDVIVVDYIIQNILILKRLKILSTCSVGGGRVMF